MSDAGGAATAPHWLQDAVQQPCWYTAWASKLCATNIRTRLAIHNLLTLHPRAAARPRSALYRAFEAMLEEEQVCLATHDPGWDAERLPIDTLVIHHTKRPPGMRTSYLSAMHLIRLYVPIYNEPSINDVGKVENLPIGSGHWRRDRQVFWGYHWLIRTNGQAERLLYDHEIGWHAGHWPTNRSSVAICIDDDLQHSSPSVEAIAGSARTIEQHYPTVTISPTTVLGHREVGTGTSCPGSEFLPRWKQELLRYLKA